MQVLRRRSQMMMVIVFTKLYTYFYGAYNYLFYFIEFDLPTYEEAILMDQDIDISVNGIEESIAKLYVDLT